MPLGISPISDVPISSLPSANNTYSRTINESITGPVDGSGSGTITQVGSFTQSAATATNPAVVSTPTGAAIGDLLLFFVAWYDQTGATVTPPSGATLVSGTRIDHATGGDDSISSAIYQLALVSAPAGSYTFSTSPTSSFGMGVTCICLRGAASIDTGAGAPTINSNFNSAPTALGLTTSNASEWVILFFLGDINTSVSSNFPTFTFLGSGSDARYASFATSWNVGTFVKSSAGATGNFAATLTGNDDWACTLIAVVPTSGSGVARVFTGSRAIPESITAPSDAVARVDVGRRAIPESITAPSDAVARVLGRIRAIPESITAPSDAVTRQLVHSRAIAESITAPSDSVIRQLVQARAIPESITVPSDAVTRLLVNVRAIPESITGPSDALARVFIGVRSIPESIVAPSDVVSRLVVNARVIPESITAPSDALARVGVFLRSIPESITAPSDSVAMQHGTGGGTSYTKSISESITGPTDALARVGVFQRSVPESITAPSDALARLAADLRSIPESITAPSDTVARVDTGARAIPESITAPSDAITHALVLRRSIPESITAPSDAVARVRGVVHIIVESITAPSDSIARAVQFRRLFVESIASPFDGVAAQITRTALPYIGIVPTVPSPAITPITTAIPAQQTTSGHTATNANVSGTANTSQTGLSSNVQAATPIVTTRTNTSGNPRT